MPFGVKRKAWERWNLRDKAAYFVMVVGIPTGVVLLIMLASFLTQGMTSLELLCFGLAVMLGFYLLMPR
tara:strand:+ start:196 stop:402 length:207 start_codon:yes stop_codon:yes gene_type:complete